MRFWRSGAVATAALLVASTTPLWARQNIVKNGSVELGDGPGAIDEQIADKWTEVGINIERSPTVNLVPPGPGHALKAFGDGDNTSVSAFQEVTGISPGQSVSASVWLHTPGFDKLGGSGQAGLRLEFLNQFGGTIGAIHEVYVLNASSPADTWIPASIGPLTAPANTSKVRVTCRLFWTLGNIQGAAYWDDARLTVNNGPNLLLNGDFETAGPSPGQSAFGITDWIGFNDQEKSPNFAEHGAYSLKLGTRSPFSGLFQNMLTLDEGEHLYMLAWVWNPSDNPLTGSSRAGIKLEWQSNVQTPPPEEVLAFDENSPNDVWTLVSLDTVVPDDVNVARIVMVYFADGGTTGVVAFDSARAERSSQPGVNKLLNASFENGPGGADGLTDWNELFTSGSSELRKACFSPPPHNGFCTARGTGTAPAFLTQEIAVAPGEGLHIEAYLLSPSSAPLTGPVAKAGVKVEWLLGSLPPIVDIGDPEQDNQITAGAPTNTWIPLTIDFVMPPGTNATARYVDIIEKGSAVTGEVYFDSHEAVVLNRFDGSDADADFDEDMVDFANFQRCFTGSGGGLIWNCLVNDSDDDGDIDLTDWNFFRPRMTAPN